MSINKFTITTRDCLGYLKKNWKPDLKAVLVVVFSIIGFFIISAFAYYFVPEEFFVGPTLLIFIFATYVYYRISDKKIESGFSYALLLSAVFLFIINIRVPTTDIIVFNYLAIPVLLLTNVFFITGIFMLFKNKRWLTGFYGFVMFFVSMFIFEIIRDSVSPLLINTYSKIDILSIFYNNYIGYIALSIQLGLTAFVHYNWLKDHVSLKMKSVYIFFSFGVVFTALALIWTVGGLILLENKTAFILIQRTTGLFGFNYLIMFTIFGLLSYFILEKNRLI